MKFILVLVALLFINITNGQHVSTKDSLLVSQLNEIVVTTKLQQQKINIAHSTEIINLEKQNGKGTNSMYGLLNNVSGVYMVDMGNEQHAMSIRLPINYNPLYNYLEDGIPLRPVGIFNNNELLEINRFAANKIEIVKGPFSSGYGAHSIGAAVNFIQKKYENINNQICLQSNGFGQAEIVLQTKFKIGSWNLFTNINRSQRNVNNAYHFDYAKNAITIGAEIIINKNNFLLVKHNAIIYAGDQRDGYDSATFYNKNYNSFDKFSDRKTTAIRNSIMWKHSKKNNSSFVVTLFNRIIFEKQNPFYLISYDYANPLTTEATGQITKDKFTSFGFSIENNLTSKNSKWKYNQNLFFDYTPNNKYSATFIKVKKAAGVNVSFTNTDSLLTDYKANLKNIALSNSVQFMPTDKIIFYVGLRADVLSYKFNNFLSPNSYSGSPSGSNTYYGINPELSFLYKINKEQSFFIQLGKGFTPPILSNLYRGVKTPTLVPAKYFNTEIGYKLISSKTSLLVSIYNMNGKDEFVSVIRNTGVDVVNAGKTLHRGIELQFVHNFKNFEIEFSPSAHMHTYKSYTDYGVIYDGNKINGAPTYLHNLNATYTFGKIKNIKLTAEWNKVGNYYINQSNTKRYNGYDLFNLKTTMFVKKYFFNIGVNNIFNKVYATNADGTYGIRYYPGLKRTLQAGLTFIIK